MKRITKAETFRQQPTGVTREELLKVIEATMGKEQAKIATSILGETGKEKKTTIQRQITSILKEIGISFSLKGFTYMREAIKRIYCEPDLLNGIYKNLLVQIAEEYQTTVPRVERCLRHEIHMAWEKGDHEVWNEIFGYYNKRCPTVKTFIATIVDYLRETNG